MRIVISLLVVAFAVTSAHADEVLFKNGDRLTGEIKSLDGGKLTIKTTVAGEVTVEMKDVQTFSTDDSKQIRLPDKSIVRDKVGASATATTQASEVVVGGQTRPVGDIKKIIPPAAWKGSILVNGNISRGNTHSTDLGVSADASLRRDDETHDDRFGLGGAYNFGNQTVDGEQTTSADNWFGQAKYDKFFDEKWYGYGLFRVDHDRLADLNYRLAPGVGVGYQWIESADFNFSTEAGVSYVVEDYTTGDSDERVALRLAYHVDKKLNDKVSLFHNLEWLPAFDDVGDYNLNVDGGVRAMLTESWFSEFKILWQQDSTPAPGADENDVRFILGVGWAF